MDDTKNNHEGDSSDDELPNHTNHPVNNPPILNHRYSNPNHSKQHADSGIEIDQNSSSSTLSNQLQTNKNRLLFPSSNRILEETTQPTLIRRVQQQRIIDSRPQNRLTIPIVRPRPTVTYSNRSKRQWLRSLLIGLLLLLILFLIYLSLLDRCSRSTLIQTICHKIIRIEREGLPPI